MKKLIVIVLAVLLLTFAAVSAQETAVREIIWEDVSSHVDKLGIEGMFYNVSDVGLMMWIPSIMNDMELTEEDMADGMILFLATDDADRFVIVNYVDMEGETLDDAYVGLQFQTGYEDVEMGVINGLKVLTYTATDYDMMGLSFLDEDGYMIQFLFMPMSDKEYEQLAVIMAASIQESW